MKPVIFATDALLFVLLVAVCSLIVYARRQEHLRAPWREVLRRPIAMAALPVLLAYMAVAVLDSLHFYPRLADSGMYDSRVSSVLDTLLKPLRERVETSYSAPLATHATVRSPVRQADGSERRDYPRLQWGGRHLADPYTDAARDILRRTALGAMLGFIGFMLFSVIIILYLSRFDLHRAWRLGTDICRNRLALPWYAMCLCGALLATLFGIVCCLAAHYHVLGTDKAGQDVLYQSLKGIRTGVVIGTLTTLVMLPFALSLGLIAGYFKGWVDDLVQYLYTTLNSIPGVLLIAAMILLLQFWFELHADEFLSFEQRADMRLLFLCLILGITSWTGLCRLLRGEALKLSQSDYVSASRVLGASSTGIIWRHLLPNVMHIVMISVTLDFSGLVLAEAVLSYINIGVDPATYSWGNMINTARLELAREPVIWWSLMGAFLFMFVLVLAANIFADAVRDAFDPRIRGTRV